MYERIKGGLVVFLVLALCVGFCHPTRHVPRYNEKELGLLRAKVKEMFFHGFNNYMKNAYPADELKPLSCKPRERLDGQNDAADGVDLVLGRFQLTLLDSLDTLYIMGEKEIWKEHLNKVIETVSFDSNLDVSVFETNIRILGGLLSNYLFAVDEGMSYESRALLYMSVEIADKLIPAFLTPTGLPVSKVNLKTGSTYGQPRDVCTACAGTFILEFGLLSRLTGNSLYEEAALSALTALHNSSAKLAFMGAQVNVDDGTWAYTASGVGAGVDSLYEYLIKAYILFGDEYYFNYFTDIYQRVMAATLIEDWHLQTNIHSTTTAATWTDALGAFWPGMQVLVGDLSHARNGFDKYWSIWRRYGAGLPERWDVSSKKATIPHHSLRPELIESAYMLHSATQDPFYVYAAVEMMKSYDRFSRVPCGFANMANVATKELEDKMESFFLSETLKYLYLIFTPDHPINTGNYIFTTEAHPIRVNTNWRRRDNKQLELVNGTCAAPEPCRVGFFNSSCQFSNSLYQRESRKFGGKSHLLQYLINGMKHSDIQNVGAHILPSDRQVIVSVLPGSGEPTQHFYAIRAAFGGAIDGKTEALPMVVAQPLDACGALENVDQIKGKIVIAYRGGCTFAEKAELIEKAGAEAIVFVNHLETAPFTMSDDKWHPSPVSIPLVIISKEDGDHVRKLTGSIIQLQAAHPHSPHGVLQFVLQLHPSVPQNRWPPVGSFGQNTAFKYGDGFVLMSQDQSNHVFQKDWESSSFQVFVGNETAPFSIARLRPEL
jgi:mannosidase alpha-like ER degradation enhancer 1